MKRESGQGSCFGRTVTFEGCAEVGEVNGKKQIGTKQSQTVYCHENHMKGRSLIRGGQ